MSSSFGGSGGTQGTIRYRIEVDQGNLPQTLSKVNSTFQQTNNAMMQTGRSAGALSNNFRTLGGGLPVTPLGQFQSTVGALPATFDKTGAAAQKAGSKMASFGEKFRGNKGLVFGAAGLSSAMAEAVGMLDMFAMASEQAAEATAKVNQLTEQGITEGKEYSQAINDQTKAEKFLSMARRNTMLSMMDNVFFGTMVISQLTSMNMKAGILGKTFGKLKDFVRNTKVESTGFTGALNGMDAGFRKAGKGAQFLGMSFKSIGIIAGISAAIGLAALAIEHFTQKAEAAGPGLTAAGGKFRDMAEDLKEFTDAEKEAAKNYGLSVDLALASQEIARLSKKLGELKLKREEALRPKHIGRATQKPNQAVIDGIDEEIKSTEELLNKYVDMGQKIDQRERATKKLISVEEQLAQARDEDLAKNALRKKNEEDGIKRAGDASKAIQDLTKDVLDLSKGYNELSKVGKEFNEVLNVTASAGTSAQILGIVDATNKLGMAMKSGPVIEIERLNNEFLTLSNERTPEWRDAQIQAFEDWKEAVKDAKAEWLDFMEEFNSEIDIGKALGIKEFDSDEFAENIIGDLPKKLENKIKKNLKFDLKGSAFAEGLSTSIQGVLDAMPDGTFEWDFGDKVDTQKGAEKFAKSVIENIDDEFGKGGKNAPEDLKNLRDKLKAALDRGASESEIKEILTGHIEGVPDMTVAIDQASIDAIEQAFIDAITNSGKGWDMLINPPKVPGFEMDEADWEKLGLGEGPDYPGDTNWSDEWSKLTDDQKRKLKKMGLVPKSTPGDAIDDSMFYNGPANKGPYAKPRFMWDYDQPPHFQDDKGNMWMIDPFTGKPYNASKRFSRNIMPENPAGPAREFGYSGAVMGMGGSGPGGSVNQKFGSYDISKLSGKGIQGLSGSGLPGTGGNQIQLNNSNAVKAVDVVAKRIASLSAIPAIIKLVNTTAIKAVDVVAVRIASLTSIPAVISLANTAAIKVTDVVAKRIASLTTIEPQISLQNKKAIKVTDVVAKRIVSLEDIEPQISLQNKKAIKVVDVVAKRIMSLENLNPSVTVKVGLSGPGAPFIDNLN